MTKLPDFDLLNDTAPPYLEAGLSILLILILAGLMVYLGRTLIRVFKRFAIQRVGDPEDQRRVETLARAIRYLLNIILVAVTGMLVLTELGISIAPLLGAAGVVGIAVGFGAQSLVKDYFTGFFLLLEDQIRVGDVVKIADQGGLVEEVTLRHVRLRGYEGNVHFIPNSLIDKVTNMTLEFSYALIEVGVAYRENLDEVFQVIRDTGEAMRQDVSFGPFIVEDLDLAGVEDWGDSSVNIRCRIKVIPLKQWDVRREFLKRLKAAFEAHGIEIPYPHLTVYAGQDKEGAAPPMHLTVDGKPGLLQNILRKRS